MTSFQYPRLWKGLGWFLVGNVVVLSLSPKVPDILMVSGSDKVNHFLAYLVMMCWFSQLHREPRRQFWIGVGFFTLGVFLELVQNLLAFRLGELADAAANGCGILAGWILTKTRLGDSLGYLEGRLLRMVRRS